MSDISGLMGIIGFVGAVVLVLGCGIFLGLAPDDTQPEPVIEPTVAPRPVSRSTFFTNDLALHGAGAAGDPRSVAYVLSLLERHVRQEQAAVEEFIVQPSEAQLKRGTTSPFAN